MDIVEEMFNRLKRKITLLFLTNGCGKIKIEQDKVLCNIKKRTLNYTFNAKKYYNICLKGYDSVKIDMEIQDYFKDRPIYYIFDGMTFDKGVRVETFFDANVIFRNCTFNSYIEVAGVNNIVFENNKYLDNNESLEKKRKFFGGYGKKIKFVNDNLVNANENGLGMDIKFNNVSMINSSVDLKDGDSSVKTKDLVLDDAIIECSSMNLDCDDFTYKGSSVIDAKRKIVVNNKNNNFDFGSAYAPIMINNGSIVKENENESDEVISGRQMLLSQLKGISKLFSSINSNNLRKVEEKINNRAIGKIKKK